MKKIILLISTSGLIFAYQAVVKHSDIKVSVNNKEFSYKKNDKFTLKSGDKICYISGKGRVVINIDGFKSQLTKYNKHKCKTIQGAKIIQSNSSIHNPFEKTTEDTKAGVSLKSVSEDDINNTTIEYK